MKKIFGVLILVLVAIGFASVYSIKAQALADPNILSSKSEFVEGGDSHTLVIKNDSSLWALGNNF